MASDRTTFHRRPSPRPAPARRSPRRAARQPPPEPPRQTRWWWRPRVRSALFLGVLAIVTACARMFAQVDTDWLWFHELHQERVFWTILASECVAGGLAGLATTT